MTLHERWQKARTVFTEDDCAPDAETIWDFLKKHNKISSDGTTILHGENEDYGDGHLYDCGDGMLVFTSYRGNSQARQEM